MEIDGELQSGLVGGALAECHCCAGSVASRAPDGSHLSTGLARRAGAASSSMPEPTLPPATPRRPAYSAWRRGSRSKARGGAGGGAGGGVGGHLRRPRLHLNIHQRTGGRGDAAARAARQVPFGNSGMLVTEVCVGTMTWGSFNAQEAEAHAQLDEAVLALGANFIDTAELYPVAFNYGKTTEKWIGFGSPRGRRRSSWRAAT